jgi:demethylmenaquinone methyltransferase/2-methoxy-6-polyprenyl-1,4-benzoquinol methylase
VTGGVPPEAARRPTAPPEHRVRRMFDEIVPRYDLVNDVLSMGMDRWWRRAVMRSLRAEIGAPVLDVGCGTGRLAELAARDHRVVGVDVSFEMLAAASARRPASGDPSTPAGRVHLVQGSVFRLPFADGAFGGAVSGFVLRNLDDLPGAFAELTRVLQAGAGISIVDITEPASPLRRRLFDAYFRVAAPLAGGLAGQRDAYRYLVRSLANLPPPQEVGRMLADAGAERVRWRALPPGMVTLWTARRA